jgi:SH3-like domain-containing protein
MTMRITILFFFISISCTQFLHAKEKYWSLKNDKVNVRYGHGKEHAIKYVYRKLNLPIKEIDKKENWRRIIDLKNNSGWIHRSQLKQSNSIIILEDKILFKKPSNFSKPMARLKKGRLLIIKKCAKDWCKVITDDYSGWIKTDKIWGSTK